ncbi:MAG: xanthine dehydrogenase family protein subunit M [Chloroflexota bacterium]
MIPAQFDYTRPASIEEALRILARRDPGTKVISGGMSLLPLLKLRLAEVDTLVDIGRLPELHGIREGADGGVIIGSAVTYREVLESALVAERAPLITEVVNDIGDVQVRNRGTLGGSLAHADPASDIPAAVLALDAMLALRSVEGQRAGPVDGFFRGPFETAIKPTELVIEVRIPKAPAGAGAAYRSLTQPASGYSMVGVAAVVARSGGAISHARVALTGVGEVAYRAKAVEAALLGSDGSADAIAAAAEHAADGQQVNGDIHADAEYRAAMAVVFTRRAIEAALVRAAS